MTFYLAKWPDMHIKKLSPSRWLLALSLVVGLYSVPAEAQEITRLTFSTSADIAPAWDPRGVRIAFIRNRTVGGSVYEAYKVESSGQGGEQPLLTGLNTDFGVAVNVSWIGKTGFLAVEEAISGFEVLSFNTALAPYDRTITNGADSANGLLLSIDGGGGGGITKISRDGTVALVRFSSSGGGGAVSIRSDLVANMSGVSSAFGDVLLSANVGGDNRYANGAALTPDGSQFVLPIPIGSSTTAHDLYIGDTVPSAPLTNITNTASSGFFNIYPDISPDGSKIVFVRKGPNSGDTYDLYTIDLDGDNLTQVTNTPNFDELYPSWSPDGGKIAYAGKHVVGHESETPALEAGESANWNIYFVTLPKSNIVTPKTVLTEPPYIRVESRTVFLTFAVFVRAQKTIIRKAQAMAQRLAAATKNAKIKYSFNYQLVVNKVGGRKRDIINRTSKRNTITIKNLAPGTYTAKYRVEIVKKEGSATSVVGRTKFSPSATFSIS